MITSIQSASCLDATYSRSVCDLPFSSASVRSHLAGVFRSESGCVSQHSRPDHVISRWTPFPVNVHSAAQLAGLAATAAMEESGICDSALAGTGVLLMPGPE